MTTRKNIVIKPESLPRERSDIPGSEMSSSFLSTIDSFLRCLDAKQSILFDLTELGWITPIEIVTLVCAIRKAAESQIFCNVKMPGSENLALMWTLHNYRFAQQLGALIKSEPWQKQIHFDNYRPPSRDISDLNAERKVLPISWIDYTTFGYQNPPSNLYLEDPEFTPEYVRFLKAILSRHGFVVEDTIDDFVRGVLREIGWNAVIHSNNGKSPGFAAFAGQIFDDTQTLHFALADAGCGIAANLTKPYKLALKQGKIPNYQHEYACTGE